jgi:hypothetical protein
MQNTSQDPDYYGPTGHEKKFHKTHFEVVRTLKKSKKPAAGYEWVKVGAGKYKRIKKELQNAEI